MFIIGFKEWLRGVFDYLLIVEFLNFCCSFYFFVESVRGMVLVILYLIG